MSLQKHLEPATYWEKRCALLEESVYRLIRIISTYSMPPAGESDLWSHVRDWDRLIVELNAEHPAPHTKETSP